MNNNSQSNNPKEDKPKPETKPQPKKPASDADYTTYKKDNDDTKQR